MQKIKRTMLQLISNSEAAVLMLLVVLVAIIGSVNPNFLGLENILDVLRTTSYNFIVAVPLTCLLICGEIDLCFGAVTSLAGIACGWAIHQDLPIIIAIMIGLGVGLVLGLLKAFLLGKIKLPGFITTLGMQYAISGLVLLLTGGTAIFGFPDGFKKLGQSGPLPKLYWTIIIALVLGLLFDFMLRKTRLGRSFYAVGGNRETARLAGIDINKVALISHLMVSVGAAAIGILKAARFNSAQPAAGTGSELLIICAVIIGGTAMAGGKGSILGSFLGCLLVAVIDNGLILMRISSYWNSLIFGTILILSLVVDLYRQKQLASRKL